MPGLPRFDPADFPGDITRAHVIPAATAEFAQLPADLRPELVAALGRRGIERLYSHQAEAYDAVKRGRHLVVVTPTASGKTLCYNLPVLQRLLERPEKRALYVYPTKALAQDQLAELGALKSGLPIDVRVDTYDGDTPPGRRTAIREGGHIVMTNPDMLHTGLLPHHTRWRRLFSSLEFVVIDELHTYRGLFGSQVANVIRRLKRICAFYGSHPTFICASATIRNPRELATRLLEEQDIALVERSGAPRGERRLVFYNPPLLNRDLGVRRSSMLEARRIAAPWIKSGVQTIVFCRSRLAVEVMLSYLRQDLAPRLDVSKRVRGYRAGYLPLHRREIEAGLRNRANTPGVSTHALELGLHIRGLHWPVVVGYPGTTASTPQQLGRARRRSGFRAEEVPLRRILADNVVIIDTSQPRPLVIGEMDQFTAPVLLHEEAVYLHEGAQYHVDRLDWDEKKAYVRPVAVDYYTDALASVTVQVLETFAGPDGDGLTRSHGEVKITSLASMFKKIRFHTHENIGAGPIHLPEQTLHTTGYWISVDAGLWHSLGAETLEAGLQGMAHSLRHVASLRLMCDPRDLGSVAEVRSVTTQLPTVTLFEVYPGGVGFASRMYELHRELLENAAALVRDCPCAAGCPSCVGPLHLVEGAKEACLRLLEAGDGLAARDSVAQARELLGAGEQRS